jgi:hypothetical protein
MGDSTKTGAWANIEETVGEIHIDVAPTVLGASALFISAPARYAGRVSEVAYYPRGGITGAADNNRRLRVYNRGTDGAGTKQVAERQYVADTNLTAKTKNTLTLSGTAADLVVAAGDVFEFATDHIGTGIADPGGKVVIKVDRA